MVADIVGSSLIMQEDRYRDFDLHGTFQSLLQPVIEQGGGHDIEFTGDDVSARFRSYQSAVKTGFALHEALSEWNISHRGPALTARVGIYADNVSNLVDAERQQHLSLLVADRLQSLGRADALCVSTLGIDEVKPVFSAYVHSLGAHDLGVNQGTAPVYYYFANKPDFFTRQQLRYNCLNYQSVKKIQRSFSLLLIFILMVAIFFFTSVENNSKIIEIAEIQNFSAESHEAEISSISRLLTNGLNAAPGIALFPSSDSSHIDFRLVCSFQHVAGQVRLAWAILRQHDNEQIMGGDVTGKTEDMAKLEKQLVQIILYRLNKG